MKRKFIAFNCLTLSFLSCFGQNCTITPNLTTINPACTGVTLTVSATQPLSTLTWLRGQTVLSTVSATVGTTSVVSGYGTAANQLSNPIGICGDSLGNIYISDQYNNRIQKFAPNATQGVTVAGGAQLGSGSAANQFNNILGVAIDIQGNLYGADSYNYRIQKWARNATSGTTVAGGNGEGYGANQFQSTYGVTVDKQGNVYVADFYGSVIKKWARNATTGTIVAGNGVSGTGAAYLNNPYSVYIDDNNNLYIADFSNDRVQKWAAGATTGVTVAGGNGFGGSDNELNGPTGVFVDKQGNVFVVDRGNQRVQKWAVGAITGVTVAGGNGRGSAANQLNSPASVYVDAAGSIYVVDTDNQRVQKIGSSGIANLTFRADTAGVYTARVTDVNGCTGAATKTVNPNPQPRIAGATAFCQGTTTTLDAGNFTTFKWSANANNATTRTINVGTTGNFVVTVTDANGCLGSDSTLTKINPKPSPSFSDSIKGGKVILTNNSTGAATYLWQFGDLANSTATTKDATFTYPSNGAYTVKLIVTSAENCKDSTSKLLTLTRVAVQDVALLENIKLYPNPTTDEITLSFQYDNLIKAADVVTLTNELGQEVVRQALKNSTSTLSLRQLPEGLYLLNGYFNGQKYMIGKVLKTR